MSNNAPYSNGGYNNSTAKGRGGVPPQKSSNPDGKYKRNKSLSFFLEGNMHLRISIVKVY
jgi:hypothetical protein